MALRLGEIVVVTGNINGHNYVTNGVYIIASFDGAHYRLRHIRTQRKGNNISGQEIVPLSKSALGRKKKISLFKESILPMVKDQQAFWTQMEKNITTEIGHLEKYKDDKEEFATFIAECIKAEGDVNQIQKKMVEFNITPEAMQGSALADILGMSDQVVIASTTWDTEEAGGINDVTEDEPADEAEETAGETGAQG